MSASQQNRPDLTFRFGYAPCGFRGNRQALRSLTPNLLDNAARHTRTSVDVSVTVSGGETRIQVDDDGDGLSPEDCERVFYRCVRLDESRDRNEGAAASGSRSWPRSRSRTVDARSRHPGQEGTSPSPCETRPRPSPRPDLLFACWHAEGGCGLAEGQHNAPPQSIDATSIMCRQSRHAL
ncbi:MAG: ATP-binding protein [Candidatus Nanopelagicales bacterium]